VESHPAEVIGEIDCVRQKTCLTNEAMKKSCMLTWSVVLVFMSVGWGLTPASAAGTGSAALSTHFDGELSGAARAPDEPRSLWYRQPAREWLQALAIGNGRLSGMVFGGIQRERIQLNEDTFWSGGPYDPTHAEALEYLPEARRLTFAGKYLEACKLIDTKLLARPGGQMSYQPIGDLLLEFPGEARLVQDYRHDLNLDTAISSVSFRRGGVGFAREVFVSPVDQVLVMRLQADQRSQISFDATLKTPQNAQLAAEGNDTLVLRGIGRDYRGIKGALKFDCRVRLVPRGGSITVQDGNIRVRNADSALVLLDAATSYKNWRDISGDPGAITRGHLAKAGRFSFERLKARHVAEHQRLFRRVKLDLGGKEAGRLPTD